MLPVGLNRCQAGILNYSILHWLAKGRNVVNLLGHRLMQHGAARKSDSPIQGWESLGPPQVAGVVACRGADIGAPTNFPSAASLPSKGATDDR